MPKRRGDEELNALFVRLPREHAEKLDRVAFTSRVPKRDIVTTLIADHLPENGPLLGRAEALPAQADDVLTTAQAAQLLQVDADAVVVLAESGDLPGRRIGDDWRFLRSSVLSWLAG